MVAQTYLNSTTQFDNFINSNPIILGCMMLFMNLGGRYVVMEVPTGMSSFFSHPWVRKLTIFFIVFMATRSIKTAFLLFLIFILFSRFLMNEKSKSCMPSLKKLVKELEEKENKIKKNKESTEK